MSRKESTTVYRHTPESVKFVKALIDKSFAVLIRHGENSRRAKRLSSSFVIDICQQITGSSYFGKNTLLVAAAKSDLIRRDHDNGKSIKQLAEQYHLSARRIYQILFSEKDKPAAKASTTCAPLISIAACRMFIKAGIAIDDATEAARGVLAVITAKLGGAGFYAPSERRVKFIIRDIDIFRLHKAGKSNAYLSECFGLSVENVARVIENYPVPVIPGLMNLPIIRKQLAIVTAAFREYTEENMTDNFDESQEVVSALDLAAERISRAEEIISRLKG